MDTGDVSTPSISLSEAEESLSPAAAARFAEKWKGTIEEQQNSQAFWQDFFREVLRIHDLQDAGIEFEKKVISSKKGTVTRIDVYWKDTLLVEQKSAGKDLDQAEAQAREYVFSLPPAQRPPTVVVSDFARFRIVDIILNKSHEFLLENLPENLHRIEAIAGKRGKRATHVQVAADQKAAQLMADLYVQMEKYGYQGHEVSVFMVRILFCLFADDTRMWKTDLFENLIKDTNPLGTDLGPRLSNLFALLDTPKDERRGPQDPLLIDFPYVNGGIFSERLETINFNTPMRNALMNACSYDWSSINPTIFGSLFQDIKSKEARHANGEHYTTEENIDKTIEPLFLDELQERLAECWDNESKLRELQRDLGSFQILDPACGCGNFLITTYKRLRQIELDIVIRLKQLDGTTGQVSLFDVSQDLYVKLEQLHGIEYVEWSSQIAKVAIYLTDHQENLKLETVLGVAANRFPLSHAASIVQGNALEIDWATVCPMGDSTVIVGNPPFLGSLMLDDAQKDDQKRIWSDHKKSGLMDYVSNWYLLAAAHLQGTKGRAAFVSTNSITQGEQPAILWHKLQHTPVFIDFAHRTFNWDSEASGKAAVHCVIIGFSATKSNRAKRLFVYDTVKSEPRETKAKNINAYLADGPDLIIGTRQSPLNHSLLPMYFGSMPRDNGHLSNISPAEAEEIRATDVIAAKYLRRLIGSTELINATERFCLWLEDAEPRDLASSPVLKARIAAVREMRLASNAASTRSAAATSHLFVQRAQPKTRYIAVPRVSSEARPYVPMAVFEPDVIASDALLTIPNADDFIFGLVMSSAFNVWNRAVSGRLKSDCRISQEITYNNFPIPEPSESQRAAIEMTSREITTARMQYPNSSLSDLYRAGSTPIALHKAHLANDKAVLALLGARGQMTEVEILQQLFACYEELSM
jgi:hypothetical protein